MSMLRDFVLIVLGVIVAFLSDHLKDIWRGIMSGPLHWWPTVKGVGSSWRGWVPVLVIIILASFALNAWDSCEHSRSLDLEEKRANSIIDAINRQTEAILKAIDEINGVQSGNTTQSK
jgi:hypothetical protein